MGEHLGWLFEAIDPKWVCPKGMGTLPPLGHERTQGHCGSE